MMLAGKRRVESCTVYHFILIGFLLRVYSQRDHAYDDFFR